jgi:predicted AAA+ superfamily ATPase
MSNLSFPRLLQPRLEDALDDTPVVLLHGPRQCGKTTLVQKVGEQRGYTYFSFDDVNLVAAAKADPIGFVDRLADKVILDEVQHVPELFSSIKQAVDKNRRPGRFLLTGSANVLLLPKLSDSLAGRMEVVQLRPLSRCEIDISGQGLLPHMFNNSYSFGRLEKLGDALANHVIEGGYPEPLQRKTAQRKRRWHRNYIDTLVQRDIRELARISNLDVIPKILELAAAQSAQLLNMSKIAAPFQISRQTVSSYFTLLENIFLLDVLPAWYHNRGKRLVKTPKVHISDTGLAAALLGITAEQLHEDRALLGHLLESFVYNELRRQASWHHADVRFYHYRDKDQYEVDIVMEQEGGGIAGVEVKAASTVSEADFRGLKRLQAISGKAWKSGVLFYDGDISLSFGDSLFAIPLHGLWYNG